MYENIDEALKDGCRLHAFRSGGGLRVIRLEKGGKLKGYGEHPDVLEALNHAQDDYKAGGRPYHEVYGGTHPHYLTGSSEASGPLDRWLLGGHTFDASIQDGRVQVELIGTEHQEQPEGVLEKVTKNQETVEWAARGFRFRSTPSYHHNGVGCSTKVVSSPEGKKDAWYYSVVKQGQADTFFGAVEAALSAEPVER
jgi:hypothetical protein